MTTFPIITVAGGSCSGKTTFAKGFKKATQLSIDSFYKDISQLVPDKEGKYNWDTPEAFELDVCRGAVETLASGKDVTIPTYDYVSAKRVGKEVVRAPTEPGSIIVLEGLFTLCAPLEDLGILRIFIEAPPEIRIARRIKRDVSKGRSATETLSWFVNVEKGHQKYIEPSKVHANLVIPFSHSPIVFSE